MFAKRHYEALAATFRDEFAKARMQNEHDHNQLHDCLRAMCDLFAKDNPKFDRERFVKAATRHT